MKNSQYLATGENPLRIGLVGVTGYAFAYFEDLDKLVREGRAQWGAVTIINPESASDQVDYFKSHGVPIYSDYREMLEKEHQQLDWACIPTGIGWHARMTVDSLNHGLHVLVEKPLAPTLQDIKYIQEAEAKCGKILGVGFQHTYIRETWDLKERLLAGEIGEVERIDCLGLWPRSRNYYNRNEWGGRLHDGHSWILDSPLHNGLSHMVNLILFWSGAQLDKRADPEFLSVETYRAKPLESYDTVRASVQMDTGVEAVIILSHSCRHNIDPEIRITGSRGTLIWRFCGHHTINTNGKMETVRSPHLLRVREIMFENMLDRIQGKAVPICTTEMARGTAKLVNLIHDAGPIRDVPSKYRQEIKGNDGETYDTIEDLEYYTFRAYNERKTFEQVGAPWAMSPMEIDGANYTEFSGKYCKGRIPSLS